MSKTMNKNPARRHLARAAGCAGLALAALAATLPAQAQSSRSSSYNDPNAYSLLPYTRSGYVGINVGQSEFDSDCGIGAYACEKSRAGFSVYTGGLLNEWLGAEVGAIYTGQADRSGGETRGQGLTLKAVLRAPIGPFNAFVKGGAIYGETKVSAGALSNINTGKRRGWGGTYGAGLGFDFTPNQGVVLEWARHQFLFPATGRQNVDTTSLGYVYRF
jgi:hypothetical protein